MSSKSDLVRDSELRTTFGNGQIIHSYIERDRARKRTIRQDFWSRKKHLGQGGYGQVWLEECTAGRSVNALRAVKMIMKRPSLRNVNYDRELEAVAKFSHQKYEDFFVKSFGWFEDAEAIYIALEYFELGDLQHYLRRRSPLHATEARDITVQILEALHEMHDNGFAHRDLKPANILISSQPPNPWWVKLGDFGISKRAADEDNMSTVKGTDTFMAPELVFSLGRSTNSYNFQAADIWAVGEIAFQLLTGERAFIDPGALVDYYRGTQPYPSHRLIPLAGEDGADFVSSLMPIDPELRTRAITALGHRWITSEQMILDTFVVSNTLTQPLERVDISDEKNTLLTEEPSASWSVASRRSPSPHIRQQDDLPTAVPIVRPVIQTPLGIGRDPPPERLGDDLVRPAENVSTPSPTAATTTVPNQGRVSQKAVSEPPIHLMARRESGPDATMLISPTTVQMSTLRTRQSEIGHTLDTSKERFYQRRDTSYPSTTTMVDPPRSQYGSGDGQTPLRAVPGSFPPGYHGIYCQTPDKRWRYWQPSGHRTSAIMCVAFSPDGTMVASGSFDSDVELRDTITGTILHTLKGHGDPILDLCFTPDSQRFFFEALAFSPDREWVATAVSHSTIKIVGAHTNEKVPQLLRMPQQLNAKVDVTTTIAFSPDGKTLAAGTLSGVISLWDLESRARFRTMKNSGCKSISFSHDGRLLAVGSFYSITLWDTQGVELYCLEIHGGAIYSLTFSPDDNFLASASIDGTIGILGFHEWDAEGGGSDSFMGPIWHNADGARYTKIEAHSRAVHDVSFSPDGKTLASCSSDATVKLWDFEQVLLDLRKYRTHQSDPAVTSRDDRVSAWSSLRASVPRGRSRTKHPSTHRDRSVSPPLRIHTGYASIHRDRIVSPPSPFRIHYEYPINPPHRAASPPRGRTLSKNPSTYRTPLQPTP